MGEPRGAAECSFRLRHAGCRGPSRLWQQVISAQSFVLTQELPLGRRHCREGSCLLFHHVLVERWRTAHRLAGVVDDEVQPVPAVEQHLAECFHARRVPEIQSVDVEPVSPVAKIRFRCVARRRVPREPGRHDELGPAAQQLESCLVADLDPATGEQCHPAAQVGEFGALDEVEVGARRAHLVVEMVQLGEVLLADIAVLPLIHPRPGPILRLVGVRWKVLRGKVLGREDVGCGEHRLAPEGANAGGRAGLFLSLHPLGFPPPDSSLHQLPARGGVGVVHQRRGVQQALAAG